MLLDLWRWVFQLKIVVTVTFQYWCQTHNHSNKHPPGCYNTPQPPQSVSALPWNICPREGGGAWTHVVKGLIMVWHQYHPLGKRKASIQHLEETSVLMEGAGGVLRAPSCSRLNQSSYVKQCWAQPFCSSQDSTAKGCREWTDGWRVIHSGNHRTLTFSDSSDGLKNLE